MANLLNRLLQDGCLHILVHFFLFLLHICVDARIGHLILSSCTRWVFSNFFDDLEHSFEWVQNESIGRIAEMDGGQCEHNDYPDRSCQVDDCVSLGFLLYAVDDVERDSTVGLSYSTVFLDAPIIVNIGIHLAFVWVNINHNVVPGLTVWVCNLHNDGWVEILSVQLFVPYANVFCGNEYGALVCYPTCLVVVELDHEGDRVCIDQLLLDVGVSVQNWQNEEHDQHKYDHDFSYRVREGF